MKIPYGWVRELVDVDLSAEEAAERLVNAGLEVPSVSAIAPDVRGVVIGAVEAIERELGESHGHRLVLCRVSTGRETFSVVCGAPNVRVGMRAAFAPPGATLPGGRVIAVAKIRSIESQGMLCSERELGLGEEHEAGLLALDADAPLGADLVQHLGLDDRVLEIEITPNRPDCLSVLGVARELAALTGRRLRPPAIALREARQPARAQVRVRVEAPDLCPRYTVRVISGVRVGPSPAWMAARLRACGLRPISNVVDVTNYVLWELGHPLHAFDGDRVTDATFVIRRAGAGERFTTLDSQERALDASMLVIADPARAIGLAGVMGGANSEVNDATTRVFLESAYFAPGSIRRTSRTLGLRTDAAYRFERGADIEGLVGAGARAAQLIAELGGGQVARGVVDAYPKRRRAVRVHLRLSRVERVLGIAPTRAHARRILTGLGLGVRERGRDLDVEIPSFRRDLAMEDDLAEEIIRVWGYDKIPSTLLSGATVEVARASDRLRQESVARRALAGAGLIEAIGYSFTDPARDEALRAPDDPPALALLNPLTQDLSLLRQHPLDGVLAAVSVNARRRQPDVRVFEVGRTYERAPEGDTGTREPRWAAVALTGARHDADWHGAAGPVDVYDAKGYAEHVLAAFGVTAQTRAGGRLGGFEPDSHASLVDEGGQVVAEFGEVAAAARTRFDIDAPVFAAAVALGRLPLQPVTPRPQPLPRFPAVQRDMAFAISDASLTVATVQEAIRTAAGPLLREVTVFDVFRLPDGARSVAWRLTFQADDRTLTDGEVNTIHGRVAEAVSRQLGITLRGS
ncbi:MAG TPA: phenylalanine--tRNA ligase subunit beta [Methylomirabilota bacterium]|jgi:phenylalanyl-tRNA synthetase beta chain|nr:phenylalanine--tRNA ligase subunit beta [Methylomirabilota bacterium]